MHKNVNTFSYLTHNALQSNMKNFLSFLLLLVGMTSGTWAQNASDFYEVNSIQSLKISFDQDNWKYVLDSLRFNGDGLMLGDVEINGQKLTDVGVRYRKSRTFRPGMNRNALFIKLDYIRKGQNYQGHSVIELSNALRDPSMIREVLSFEIARNYIPAPQANYAKIDINGAYYGLFINLESVNDNYLERAFGSSKGAFFKSTPKTKEKASLDCKSDVYGSLQYDNAPKCYLNNFTMLSDDGWGELFELTRILEEESQNIENILDVDQTLWMLAFNNILVNLSSYSGKASQKYYLYQDKSGRFHPVIWDLNFSFGSYKNTGVGSDLGFTELLALDPMLHADNPAKPLISQLLKMEQYRKIYISHYRTILYDHFVNGKFETRAKELQNIILQAFTDDQNRFYNTEQFSKSLTSTIGKRSKIPGIVQLMNKRTSFLKKNDIFAVLPPVVKDLSVTQRERFASEKVQEFKIQASFEQFPKYVRIYYRFAGDTAYQSIAMMDDGAHNDGDANDYTYGVMIKPPSGKDVIEYYIQAENSKSISFSPTNYMFKQHIASLKALNE